MRQVCLPALLEVPNPGEWMNRNTACSVAAACILGVALGDPSRPRLEKIAFFVRGRFNHSNFPCFLKTTDNEAVRFFGSSGVWLWRAFFAFPVSGLQWRHAASETYP